MRYRITIIAETSRRMQGSDEFLLAMAQRAGLKRRHNRVRVISQSVSKINPQKASEG